VPPARFLARRLIYAQKTHNMKTHTKKVDTIKAGTIAKRAERLADKLVYVDIFGGFHKAPPIRIRLPRRETGGYRYIHWVIDAMSEGQRRKVWRHMCGIRGCECSAHLWDWDVAQ
jgi:hypothetical protein